MGKSKESVTVDGSAL